MVLQTGGRKSRKTAELIGPFRRDAGAKEKIFTSLMLFKKYRITTKILSNLRFYVKFKLHYKYFEFKLSLHVCCNWLFDNNTYHINKHSNILTFSDLTSRKCKYKLAELMRVDALFSWLCNRFLNIIKQRSLPGSYLQQSNILRCLIITERKQLDLITNEGNACIFYSRILGFFHDYKKFSYDWACHAW